MIEQIKTRRSHFLNEFNGNKAPDLLIHKLLEAAMWAPSHKLTLPFRFVVISSSKLLPFSETILDSIQSKQLEMEASKLAKIHSLPEKLSHVIALVLKPSNRVPLWEEYACLGAAVQNMHLILNEEPQFGGYWTTGNESNQTQIRTFLKLSEDEIHCGYFFIGGISTKRTTSKRPNPIQEWL
jgi:nitroreductase